MAEVFRWKFTSRAEPSPRFIDDVQPSIPPRSVEGDALRVTFINHATVLLQHRGLNILTDPVWSGRASPFTWAGPRRHRAPGVRFEDLPRIHLVLLSHNHYDHLDLATLRRLSASRFIVPLGVAKLLERERIGPVQELDWGESTKIADASIHCVPAMHFSARGLFDRNRTLWCGFVIEAARMIYFAGDTGFGEHFAQIRERYGAPDLALLPIGAYEPRWFMSAVHMSPEDAVRAHRILGAKTSIAIHHATFQLTDEAIDTPKRRLIECAPGDSFLLLNNGESAALNKRD
ncbi:MAG TPA: MBL fold metallo-hydrolase [Bryobacteraceae bacterium]|nr:MBL fold metallo-hydrolase [Bryobacteraceae bacterium]